MSSVTADTASESASTAPHATASPASSAAAGTTAERLSAFVAASPSSYHASAHVRDRLVAAGYRELDETASWSLTPGDRCVVRREGAVIAFAVPATAQPATPFAVVGAHTDSPGFKLKPTPDFRAEGACQVGVEVYGGPLLNAWLDRELCFAGQLALRDGSLVLARTGAIGRIPQLAIHLDGSQNTALKLDRQQHMQPVIALADMLDADAADPAEAGSLVLGLLAESAGVAPADVVGFDVLTCPTEPGAAFGAHGEFFASPRLDNLSSTFAGCEAMEGLDTAKLRSIAVFATFDHEEVGSETRTGASGPFLADVLERITGALGGDREAHHRAMAASLCVSSDAGHAVHPNYPGHHDAVDRPRLGRGPLLKLNANQRYASSATGTVRWARACETAGVAYQPFISKNTIPCGTTIGPLTATRLGMTTVDVGPALWSMHSAREMCALADIDALGAALAAFLRS